MGKLQKDFGVTALLALIAVLGAVLAADFLVFSGSDKAGGMAFLSSIALAGLGFYVGNKMQSPPGPPTPPAGTSPGGVLP